LNDLVNGVIGLVLIGFDGALRMKLWMRAMME
jgi:hypothetical protein